MILVTLLAIALGFFGSMPMAGPVAVLIASTAIEGRSRDAFRIALGSAAAEGAYACVAYWGFATLLPNHPAILPISQGVAAVLLLALGVRFVFWKGDKKKEESKRHQGGASPLLIGFSATALNPTLLATWSTVAAAVHGLRVIESRPLYAIPFGLGAAAGVVAWFAVLLLLFRRYRDKLPQSALTWVVRAMGGLLIVIGATFAVKLARELL